MASLFFIAAAISAALLILAFLASKVFESKVVRGRIMVGTALMCLIGGIGYFGFIAFFMSGCLNC